MRITKNSPPDLEQGSPEHGTPVHAGAPVPAHPRRRPMRPQDLELMPVTLRWLATLPIHARPLVTGQRHPHILNRMCDSWSSPPRVRAYFQELFIDKRGGRRGFSFEVLSELSNLQSYYVSLLPFEQRCVWDGNA